MDVDPFCLAAVIQRLCRSGDEVQIGFVHQPANGLPHQLESGHHNVKGYENRDDRIENQPVGKQYQYQPNDHSEARDRVGQHVLSVGYERQRCFLSPDVNQIPAKKEIDHGGECSDGHPDVEVYQFARIEELGGGHEDDRNRRQYDQQALDAGREKLDPPVAVGVRFVRRPGAQQHTVKREARRQNVDHRFHRVRKNRR